MEVITIFGKFQDNLLTDYETGEIIFCVTYRSVRDIINGKEGFFNLRPDDYDNKILFQYVLLDE